MAFLLPCHAGDSHINVAASGRGCTMVRNESQRGAALGYVRIVGWTRGLQRPGNLFSGPRAGVSEHPSDIPIESKFIRKTST